VSARRSVLFGPRRLASEDADEAARVHRAAFDDRLPWLAGRHTAAQDRDFFNARVFADCEAWGVFNEAALVGFVAFREGWIDQLYVLPAHQGRGVGAQLLDLVQARQDEIRLWIFQRNAGARRFYERRGFRAVAETDGQRNEEREPDVLYAWRREI
jgi:ribosomal protein S18 acetylase RimI-like enzyme